MRTILIFSLFSLVLPVSSQQLTPEWIRLKNSLWYIGSGRSVRVDQDNNLYILTGFSYPGWWDHGATVIKYSENGDLQWTNTFQVDTASISGFAVNRFGSSFIIFEESNFYLYGGIFATDSAGNDLFSIDFPDYIFKGVDCDAFGNVYVTGIKQYGFNNYDLVLIKLNSTGEILWEQTHDIPGMSTHGRAVVVVDSSVYAAGNSMYSNIVLKYDLEGNPQGDNIFFYDPYGDYTYRALQGNKDDEGNIYFFGQNQDMEGAIKQSFIYKFDPALNELWHDSTTLFDMVLADLSVGHDQQVYVCGYDYYLFSPIYMSYHATGEKLWHNTFEEAIGVFSSTAVSGNNIFFNGVVHYAPPEPDQLLIYRVDKQGELLSEYTYPGIPDTASGGYDMIFDNNGQLVVTGMYENPAVHCMTIKFDHLTETDDRLQNNLASPLVYPNPAEDFIFTNAVSEAISDYRIYNASGKLVKKGSVSDESTSISISSLNKGLYFLQTEKTVLKFVKN
ncbi:MAG: T9SS type A sorting domain-containing protein [Bacteroidales bacterium]|nr:T9SS type A sorting domain-containing protein [Bacteroidales bacterium]